MITGEELRIITRGFVKEADACETVEEAKALCDKIKKFYFDNGIPSHYEEGDWRAEYDEYAREGCGEMLAMMLS